MEIMDENYEINADNIDVEEIMSKIKRNIKERGYTEEEIISNFDFTPEEKMMLMIFLCFIVHGISI